MSLSKVITSETGQEAKMYGNIVFLLAIISVVILAVSCILIMLRHSDAAYCTIGGLLSGDPPSELKHCYSGAVTSDLGTIESIGMTLFGVSTTIGLALSCIIYMLRKDPIYASIILTIMVMLIASALGMISINAG